MWNYGSCRCVATYIGTRFLSKARYTAKFTSEGGYVTPITR